jgi:hypothetical protein
MSSPWRRGSDQGKRGQGEVVVVSLGPDRGRKLRARARDGRRPRHSPNDPAWEQADRPGDGARWRPIAGGAGAGALRPSGHRRRWGAVGGRRGAGVALRVLTAEQSRRASSASGGARGGLSSSTPRPPWCRREGLERAPVPDAQGHQGAKKKEIKDAVAADLGLTAEAPALSVVARDAAAATPGESSGRSGRGSRAK